MISDAEKIAGRNDYSLFVSQDPMPGDADGGTRDLRNAAAVVAFGHAALVVDNDAVHGIVADGQLADSPAKRQIIELKHHAGDGQRTYGLMVPHDKFLGLLDLGEVGEGPRALIESPDFVRRLGAIAFVRVPASPKALERHEVPACAVSTDASGQKWVQNYDPEGGILQGLADSTRAVGVKYPVITSLNRGGHPEIVDPETARELVGSTGMAYLADPFAGRKVRGSYPILQADINGLWVVREGCIGNSVLGALLDSYRLQPLPGMQEAKYPPLELDDTREPGLKGPELREALIEHLRWGQQAPLRQAFHAAYPPIR